MTKKQRIYLVNVRANLAHRRDARSPIFTAHRNSFAFVTAPDSSCLQMKPRSYGDKLLLEAEVSVRQMTDEQLNARLAYLLGIAARHRLINGQAD